MSWRSTTSLGRYAVESVTIRVVTSSSSRRSRSGLRRDDVDELRRPDDDRADAPLGGRLHLVTAERELAQVVLGDVGAHLDPVADLALDLDDAGDLLLHDLRGIAHGERGIRDPVVVTEALPHLLGDVRGYRREHEHHRLDGLTRRGVELGHGVV